jgi:putative ABC transport system permease protein
MKYLPLIWAALRRKRARTALTFFSIVIAFALFGLLHGVTAAIDSTIEQWSDTRLRIQSRVNITEALPLAHLPRIERVDGVKQSAFYLWFGGYYQDPRNTVSAAAIDPARMFAMYPELRVPPEQLDAMRTTRTGALIGRELAAKYGWQVGDRVPLSSRIWRHDDGSYEWAFDVVGIYSADRPGVPTDELWMNYEYFDEARAAAKGTVSIYFVSIDDASRSAAIAEDIDALFANSSDETQTLNEKDWVRGRIEQIGDIGFFVNAIVGAVLFALLFVTANTMAQSVRERIPELAILKTCGFRNSTLTWLVLAEAISLCVVAAVIGLGLAAAGFPGVIRGLGIGAAPMPWSVVAMGIALAGVVGIASAAAPVFRAGRLQIVDALAGR